MNKTRLFWFAGTVFTLACATTEAPEDLCVPGAIGCHLSSGLGSGDGDGEDGGVAGLAGMAGNAGAAGMGIGAGDGDGDGDGGAGGDGGAAGATAAAGMGGMGGSGGAAGGAGGGGAGGGGAGGGGSGGGGAGGGGSGGGGAGGGGSGGGGSGGGGSGGGGSGGGGNGGGGSGGGDSVIIHTNRCNSYVMLDGNDVLQWDNQTIGNAETFNRVMVTGGFKLQATSNDMWVRVDNANADKLIADQASEANGVVFAEEACDPAEPTAWSGISFPADNDGSVFVKANDTGGVGHLEAANASCSTSALSWEKLELCVDGDCMLTGSNQYCL